jgi:hypothetical protein
MKRWILVPCLALEACQTAGSGGDVRTVHVPTPVPCVNAADIPAEPPQVGDQFNGDAKHDLQVLAPSAQALRKWGQDLRELIANCTVPRAR